MLLMLVVEIGGPSGRDLSNQVPAVPSHAQPRPGKEIGILAEVTLLLRTRLETSLPSEPVNE